jgi:hypothetical protein
MLSIGWLGGGLMWATLAAELGNPVDEILAPKPPSPPGAGAQPLVLRPREAKVSRPAPRRNPRGVPSSLSLETTPIMRPPAVRRTRFGPPPPRFVFEDEDRVILLGGLFAESLPFGSLETRIVSQYPERDLHLRNLGWPEGGLLSLEKDGQPAEPLARLLRAAKAFQPTVVMVSLGKRDAAENGDTNAFGAAFGRLLDRLGQLGPEGKTRLLVVSPSAYEPTPGAQVDARTANDHLAAYVMQTYHAATNRQARFLNLFAFSIWDGAGLRKIAEQKQTSMRYYTDDGVKLNAFGFWRLSFGLERAFNWPPNTWRWGLMADSTFRDGGFGIDILSYQRTDSLAKLITKARRLPTPNPAGFVDLEPDTKPQCYIQLPGFRPGLYELRVDGRSVLTGDDKEWDRYEVISMGPDWIQAEHLRRAIVAKNQHVQEWVKQFDDETARKAAETAIAAAEQEIAKLRMPVQRNYEIVRIGDAPPKDSKKPGRH